MPAETSDLTGLRKLAEQGDAAAQFALGARYATGEEVKQDYSEAVRWFALAGGPGARLGAGNFGRLLLGGQRRPSRHEQGLLLVCAGPSGWRSGQQIPGCGSHLAHESR